MLINSLIFIILQEDIFPLEAADLGTIHKIKIRHDNAMLNPAWFVERGQIDGLTCSDRQFMFHCERWLAKNKEDKKIERNFYEKDYKVLVRFFSPCRYLYEAKIIVAVL